jgi:hypothetical protein
MAGGQAPMLAELGRTDEALSEAAAADQLQAAGHISFVEPRALQLRLLAEQGNQQQAPAPDPLLEAARDSGTPSFLALAFAAAAQLLLAQGQTAQARALLAELDRSKEHTRVEPYYAAQLPGLVRIALAAGDFALAAGLTAGVEPLTPLHDHALTASRAHLAEAAGNQDQAAALYARAAERWQQFGNVPERAYALLGQGRCLAALDQREAEQPLQQARELFAAMGYKQALVETEQLLDQGARAAS